MLLLPLSSYSYYLSILRARSVDLVISNKRGTDSNSEQGTDDVEFWGVDQECSYSVRGNQATLKCVTLELLQLSDC